MRLRMPTRRRVRPAPLLLDGCRASPRVFWPLSRPRSATRTRAGRPHGNLMNSRWLLRVGCLGLAACAVSANLGGTEQPIGGQLAGLTPGETITLQDNLGDN